MNKRVGVIVATLFIVGIVIIGCSKEVSNRKEESFTTEYQFNATTVEICEEYLIVDALEGQYVAGQIKVWIGLLKDNEVPKLKVGDTVRVTHDGKMTMSIPPQTSAVKISKISK